MEPLLKYYTVLDLHNWLVHNQLIEGLSDQIIAPQRAWAIIHNPYVKDSDAVLCAIFEDNKPVAYTAAFPDLLKEENRLVWWFTTLYCHPSCQGKGYGIVVIGQLCELIGEGNFFDMDGAEETVSIFNYLGLNSKYIERYIFAPKQINCNSLKGKVAYIVDRFQQLRIKNNRSKLLRLIESNKFELRYINHIDDISYQFICEHSTNDAFVRSQSMLNWILAYPFMQQTPLCHRSHKSLEFSSLVQQYSINAVQVLKDSQLVGLFIYRIMDTKFSLKYLYYIDSYMQDVFEAIAEHVIRTSSVQIQTTHSEFATWLQLYNITSKYSVEEQSFSYPDWFTKNTYNIQQGDGDVFV